MAQRFQFHLRAIFYAITIAALLCMVLPPIFRAVQQKLPAQRHRAVPALHVLADTPEEQTGPERNDAGPRSMPSDAVFFQTTIIRVNGKRIDGAADGPAIAPEERPSDEKLPRGSTGKPKSHRGQRAEE